MPLPMAFMKITVDGLTIVGNAEHRLFVDAIVIDGLSWDMNAKQSGMATSGNARAEARLGEIKLEKNFDRSSTGLATALLQRRKVSVATITTLNMELAVDESYEPKMMVLEIKDGYVEAIDLSVSGSGLAQAVKETIRISYRKIKLDYHPADTNKIGRAAAVTFELEAAKASV